MDNPFNPDYFSYRNDYPIEEIWNTDNALAQLIVPRLQAFKELDKHGYPGDFNDMRAWNKAIQKMVDAFDLMKYVHSFSEEERSVVTEGLNLFCKYFTSLACYNTILSGFLKLRNNQKSISVLYISIYVLST